MRSSFVLFGISILFIFSNGERSTDRPDMVTAFRTFLRGITGKSGTPKGIKLAQKLGKILTPVPSDVPFPCDTTNGRSATKPTSVHRLRPGDIDVIAAMGDSLTVGNGAAASQLIHIAVDNRGLSFVAGGNGNWRTTLSLPNILKEFNPNLIGYATKDANAYMSASEFNVAEPGAMSRDIFHEAKMIVSRIRSHPRVDFENDWKLVNIMIGGNDFCVDVCYLSEKDMQNSGNVHKKDLMLALDHLRDNLPRTLVNLIKAPVIQIVTELVNKPSSCVFTHIFECPCFFGTVHRHRREQLYRIQETWLKAEEEIGVDARYRQKDDFAVVLQPFVPYSRIPKLKNGDSDISFIATDCFHFSHKGGARAANSLWNNMLEKEGNKTLVWTDTWSRFLCPTADNPYIYTWKNS